MEHDEYPFRNKDLDFEWHDEKADANLEQHGVSFEMAGEVFYDPNVTLVHSRVTEYGEVRYAVVGRVERVMIWLYSR